MADNLASRISAFQKRYSCSETGIIDEATWDHVEEIEQGWWHAGKHASELQGKLKKANETPGKSGIGSCTVAFIMGLCAGLAVSAAGIWILMP